MNEILYDQEHFSQADLGKLKPLKIYSSLQMKWLSGINWFCFDFQQPSHVIIRDLIYYLWYFS